MSVLYSYLCENQVTVFGSYLSPYTHAAKYILDRNKIPFREVNPDADDSDMRAALLKVCGTDSMPLVFVGHDYLGGLD